MGLTVYVVRGKAGGKTFGVAAVALMLFYIGWASLYEVERFDHALDAPSRVRLLEYARERVAAKR